MMKLLVRGLGAALVAAVVLFPRVTIAEEVSDEERRGEYDEDGVGQRFGAVAISGNLVATGNSPSGWALVRTYENKSDAPAHVVVEERITQTTQVYAARVGAETETVLTRTQKLDLKAHEKKSIGVYVSAELGKKMTTGARTWQGIQASIASGTFMEARAYDTFAVEYLRPLKPGETPQRHSPPDVYPQGTPMPVQDTSGLVGTL